MHRKTVVSLKYFKDRFNDYSGISSAKYDQYEHVHSSIFSTILQQLLNHLQDKGGKTGKTGSHTTNSHGGGSSLAGAGSSGTASTAGGASSHGATVGSSGGGGRGSVTQTHGEGGVGDTGLNSSRVGVTSGVGGERAVGGKADGLELGAEDGHERTGGRSTPDVERAAKELSNRLDIGHGDTKGRGSQTNLLDEVGVLGVVEVHVLVDGVHGGLATVLGVAGHALLGATQGGTEELVQVGEEEVLVGGVAVGGHVLHQRSGSTVVKEVDSNTGAAAAVRRGETAIEVGEEVDISAVDLARGKDTGDSDVGPCNTVNGGLGVVGVTDDNGVDEQSQDQQLVCGSVVLEQSGGVVVTDGGVAGALSNGRAGKSQRGDDLAGELHGDCSVSCGLLTAKNKDNYY